MARGEITEVVSLSTTGTGIDGATVEVRKRSNNTLATIYTAETGSATTTNPLLSAKGRIEGWLNEGSYLANISKTGIIQPYTVNFEIVNGDTVVNSETAISTHIPATTSVHGIADTSHLITIENIGTYAPAPDLTAYVKKDGTTPITGAQEFQSSITKTTGGISKWSLDSSGTVSQSGSVSAQGNLTGAAGGQSITLGNIGGIPGVAFGSDNTTYLQRTATGMVQFQAQGTNPTKLIVKGTASQSSTNLLELQSSSNVNLFTVGPDGSIVGGPTWYQTVDQRWTASTGGVTYQGINSATASRLQIRAVPSQSTNLQEWQDSTPTTLASVDNSGNFNAPFFGAGNIKLQSTFGGLGASLIFGPASHFAIFTPGAGQVAMQAQSTNATKLIVKATASQGSINLQEWQDSNGVAQARVDQFYQMGALGFVLGNNNLTIASQGNAAPDPTVSFNNGFRVTNQSATRTVLAIRSATSQSANLQEWQDSAGGILANVTAAGSLRAPSVKTSAVGSLNGNLVTEYEPTAIIASRFNAPAADRIPIVARGFASQSANLQEWQDSTNTAQAWISPSGVINTNSGAVFYKNSVWQIWANSGTLQFGVSADTQISRGATAGDFVIQGIGTAAASRLIVKGVASQSTNLFEVQPSGSTTPLAYINSSGDIIQGDTATTTHSRMSGGQIIAMQGGSFGIASYIGRLTVKTLFASDPGIVVRGFASQSADLLRIEDSTPTTLFRVDQNGNIFGTGSNWQVGGSVQTILKAGSNMLVQANSFQAQAIGGSPVILNVDTSSSVSNARVQITGLASQSGNLQEWRDSTPTALTWITANGDHIVSSTGTSAGAPRTIGFGSFVNSTEGSRFALTNGNRASGLQKLGSKTLLYSFDGIELQGLTSNNSPPAGNSITASVQVTGVSASSVHLVVRGAAAQSVNLQEWQSSTPATLASIDAAGRFTSAVEIKAFNGAVILANGNVQFNNGSAGFTWSTPGSLRNVVTYQGLGNQSGTFVIKKGVSTQTDNLVEWQDDTGAVKGFITVGGTVRAGPTGDVESENKLTANVLSATRTRVGFDGISGIAGMTFGSSNDLILNRLAAGVLSINANNTAYPTAPTMTGVGLILQNVTTVPSTNPVGGPVIYADAGDLAVRGTSGAGNVKVAQAGKGITLTSPDGLTTKTLTLGNDGALQIA